MDIREALNLWHFAALQAPKYCLLLVDIRNAFNSLRRGFIRPVVIARAPESLPKFSMGLRLL